MSLQALCKLAVDYGQLMDQPAVVELSRSIQNSAEWGKRLSKHKPKVNDMFTVDTGTEFSPKGGRGCFHPFPSCLPFYMVIAMPIFL